MKFIEVIVSKPTRLVAIRFAKEVPLLNNSITSGEGTIAGKLGEIIVMRYTDCLYFDNYEFDLKINGSRIEVKTCRCKSPPRAHYLCKVPLANTKQRCDFYTFVRVLNNYTKGWILGSISKSRFMSEAILFREGEIDPESPKGWPFAADCLAVPAFSLKLKAREREPVLC